MQSKFKKLFAVLILTGAVLAFCSPAMARFSEVGDKRDFVGLNWTIYAKDKDYAYIITSDTPVKYYIDRSGGEMSNISFKTPFKADGNSNKYSESDLRKKVNELEAAMKKYNDGSMTWAEANGDHADGTSENYITKHDMTETARNPGFSSMDEYDDLLYVLSYDEVVDIQKQLWRPLIYVNCNWWLRSPRGGSNAYIIGSIYSATSKGIEDLEYGLSLSVTLPNYVRPALQISLKSPIFTKTDGQSDSGDVNPVKPINPHGEEEQEEQKKSSSSGGCNAGFGALALFGVLGLFYRRKK